MVTQACAAVCTKFHRYQSLKTDLLRGGFEAFGFEVCILVREPVMLPFLSGVSGKNMVGLNTQILQVFFLEQAEIRSSVESRSSCDLCVAISREASIWQ